MVGAECVSFWEKKVQKDKADSIKLFTFFTPWKDQNKEGHCMALNIFLRVHQQTQHFLFIFYIHI